MPKTQSWGGHVSPDNPEFEAQVRAHVGRPNVGAVDANVANWASSSPLNLLGVYLRPDTSQQTIGDLISRLSDVDVNIAPKPDNVYAFGPEVPATTWSHEFRHRGGLQSESLNRIYDAYYAGSPEAWKSAQDMWHDWRMRENPKVTPEESQAELLRHLQYITLHNGMTGEELNKNYESSGVEPSALAKILAGLGYPSEKFKNQVASNAPWMIWAGGKNEAKDQ